MKKYKRYLVGENIHPNVKKCISGKNEIIVRSLLESLGYIENENFIWQHIALDGCILDFAFPNEMVGIEADGNEHNLLKNKRKDYNRDIELYNNGWVIIRIDTTNMDSYHLSFYRNLIREVISERSPVGR
jgi:very-short-patch-repair endonuclease